MARDSMSYKDFLISAVPTQLDDPIRWTLEVEISREVGGLVRTKGFETANTFPTEKEAVQACLRLGCMIIDGKVPQISPTDLP